MNGMRLTCPCDPCDPCPGARVLRGPTSWGRKIRNVHFNVTLSKGVTDRELQSRRYAKCAIDSRYCKGSHCHVELSRCFRHDKLEMKNEKRIACEPATLMQRSFIYRLYRRAN